MRWDGTDRRPERFLQLSERATLGKMAPKVIEDLDDARRLQLLVEGVVDYALYTISLDGLVVSWNSGARRLQGYEPAEIIIRNEW